MRHRVMDSPLGPLTLVVDGAGALTGIHMSDASHAPAPDRLGARDDLVAPEAASQLRDYFAGQRREFDLRLAPVGTDFQLRVWQGLQRIPYGATLTYGELASELGLPNAARAVGAATGRNPLAIVVPCHRLLGAKGALTGYAGGLDRKRLLLALEAKQPTT